MRFPLLASLLALAMPAVRAVQIPLAHKQAAIPLGQTRAFEFGTVPQKPGRRAAKPEAPPEKTMVFESEELDIPVFLRNK